MTRFRVTYTDKDDITLSEIRSIEDRTNIPYLVEVRNQVQRDLKKYDFKLIAIEELE